jgi:phage gpG-like protein
MNITRNIENLTDRIDGNLPDVLELVGAYVKGEAINNLDKNNNVDKGQLKGSVTNVVIDGNIARVGSNVEHAVYIELGTKPHVIEAKNKKTLAFKVGGKMVFAKKVNHPGTRPYPFLRPAVYEHQTEILNLFKDLLK